MDGNPHGHCCCRYCSGGLPLQSQITPSTAMEQPLFRQQQHQMRQQHQRRHSNCCCYCVFWRYRHGKERLSEWMHVLAGYSTARQLLLLLLLLLRMETKAEPGPAVTWLESHYQRPQLPWITIIGNGVDLVLKAKAGRFFPRQFSWFVHDRKLWKMRGKKRIFWRMANALSFSRTKMSFLIRIQWLHKTYPDNYIVAIDKFV